MPERAPCQSNGRGDRPGSPVNLTCKIGFISVLLLSGLSYSSAQITKEQSDFFENKVRPILSEHCYSCHSLEQNKSKGGLTLDTRDGWMTGGDDGQVIVPEHPEQSSLIKAIGYMDPDLQMPPKGEKLSDADIETLTQWVKMGAPDPRINDKSAVKKKLTGLTAQARAHWAYQPVKAPSVPDVKQPEWCKTPVDNFVLAKMEEHQLTPSSPASREALIRRAYYDLTGLPPKPEEIQAFVESTDPKAYEKIVDQLLASPHYGERWGRHWLDTVRYSDTTGDPKKQLGEIDYRLPYAWTYRDYVINSFNEDKPYDQFVMEQIAADKLPESKTDKSRLAALGLLTLGKRFQNKQDVINDRIDVVTKAFVAQTVSCARCHDHMFDPIPTTDYYALHGVFTSTLEPLERPLIAPTNTVQYADFQKKVNVLEDKNRELYYKFVEKKLTEFHDHARGYIEVMRHYQRKGSGQNAETLKKINSLIQQNDLDIKYGQIIFRSQRDPAWLPFRIFMQVEEAGFKENAANALAKINIMQKRKKQPFNPVVVDALNKSKLDSMDDVVQVYTQLIKQYSAKSKAYLDACANGKTPTDLSPAEIELVQTPFSVMKAPEVTTASLHEFTATLGQLSRQTRFLFNAINELEMTHPGAPARAMAVYDDPQPKNSPVFIRGQAQVRGEIVPRHTLSIFSTNGKPPPFKNGSGRLELAQTIADPKNPLTARVMVNRIWMHHFGEGIVPTVDYFGTQSEAPSHPELLDFMANYFVENGWSVKKMHRLIMLSNVYQESSDNNVAYEKIDPRDRYLWRANIRRLDFESVRDTMLAISGKLDEKIGGHSVNLVSEPYSYRRSVYGYIDRGDMPDLLNQFDFPNPDMPNSKRNSTIVPQQALFLMNSTMAFDTARSIVGRQEFQNAQDDQSRVGALYRIIFQRAPKPEEMQLGLKFVRKESDYQAKIEVASKPLMARLNNQRIQRLTNNAQNDPMDMESEMQAAETMQMAQEAAEKNNKEEAAKNYKKLALAKMKPINAKAPIRNPGKPVTIQPLSPWETYAQALLFSNEASYIN